MRAAVLAASVTMGLAADADKVRVGACAMAELAGPGRPDQVPFWTYDNVLTLALRDCTAPGAPCKTEKLWCARDMSGEGLEGDRDAYFNSHTWATRKSGLVDTQASEAIKSCDGECGLDADALAVNALAMDAADSALFPCVLDSSCKSVAYYPTGSSAMPSCDKGFCWRTFPDAPKDVAAGEEAEGHEFVELSNVYYFKVAEGIDEGSGDGETMQCSDFNAGAPGFNVEDMIRNCDTNDKCAGFKMAQPFNSNQQFCTITTEVKKFAPRKALNFPVKVFLKQGNVPTRFYGYNKYPLHVQPTGEVIQTFGKRSYYTIEDCKSMCDGMPACGGYRLEEGHCRDLYRVTDVLTPVRGTGEFYRKRNGPDDELTTCEALRGPCVEGTPGSETATIVLASVAGVLAAVLCCGLFFRRARVQTRDITDAEKQLAAAKCTAD